MIELDMLFKTAKGIFATFPNRKREKMFFSKDNFLAVFRYSVLIRAQIWLGVVIRETTLNNDGGKSLL